MTDDVAVATDAGPLIALGKLGQLGLLLRLYGRVLVPEAVYREAVVQGAMQGHEDSRLVRAFLKSTGWPIVEITVTSNISPILGSGERAAIAWGLGNPGGLVLVDDEMARTEARRLGVSVKGTLGVLVAAHRQGILQKEECLYLLETLGERPDIWIGQKLCAQVRRALFP